MDTSLIAIIIIVAIILLVLLVVTIFLWRRGVCTINQQTETNSQIAGGIKESKDRLELPNTENSRKAKKDDRNNMKVGSLSDIAEQPTKEEECKPHVEGIEHGQNNSEIMQPELKSKKRKSMHRTIKRRASAKRRASSIDSQNIPLYRRPTTVTVQQERHLDWPFSQAPSALEVEVDKDVDLSTPRFETANLYVQDEGYTQDLSHRHSISNDKSQNKHADAFSAAAKEENKYLYSATQHDISTKIFSEDENSGKMDVKIPEIAFFGESQNYIFEEVHHIVADDSVQVPGVKMATHCTSMTVVEEMMKEHALECVGVDKSINVSKIEDNVTSHVPNIDSFSNKNTKSLTLETPVPVPHDMSEADQSVKKGTKKSVAEVDKDRIVTLDEDSYRNKTTYEQLLNENTLAQVKNEELNTEKTVNASQGIVEEDAINGNVEGRKSQSDICSTNPKTSSKTFPIGDNKKHTTPGHSNSPTNKLYIDNQKLSQAETLPKTGIKSSKSGGIRSITKSPIAVNSESAKLVEGSDRDTSNSKNLAEITKTFEEELLGLKLNQTGSEVILRSKEDQTMMGLDDIEINKYPDAEKPASTHNVKSENDTLQLSRPTIVYSEHVSNGNNEVHFLKN